MGSPVPSACSASASRVQTAVVSMVLASSTRWSSPGERAATSIAMRDLPAPTGAHDGDEAVVEHQ